MALSSQTLLRTPFPLYAINTIGDQYLMIAGGGGAAKTGVLNTIEIYEIIPQKGSCNLSKVLSKDMGRTAPMNVSIIKKKNHLYNIAIGLDKECCLFELRSQIILSQNNDLNHMEGIRNRRVVDHKSKATRTPSKEVQLDVTLLHSVCSDPKGYQKCVAIAEDGKCICTAGVDGYLRIWTLPHLKSLFEIKAHTDEVDDLCINPINNRVLTISKDCCAYLWDCKSGKKIQEFKWNGASIKYRFRNCRFATIEDYKDKKSAKSYALFTTHIPAVRAIKAECAYITKWVLTSGGYEKELCMPVGKDLPSALAIVDNGIYLGMGYLSGRVTVHISYSLQKIYEVSDSHSIFVTGLEFTRTSSHSRTLTGNHDFSLFSIAADNKLKVHQLAQRNLYSPIWAIVVAIVMIYLVFWFLSYIGS